MPATILVTYATQTGYTVGVAEAIAKTLTEGGAQVEVRPMGEVTDLTQYSAVVAGSAIQNKQWLPEAMAFVQTHRTALAQKPFAAFLVCMTLAMKNGEKYRPEVERWLDPVRAIVPAVSAGCFAGGLELRKIPYFWARLGFRISVWTGVWKEGDHRDWDAIHAWAESLKTQLAG